MAGKPTPVVEITSTPGIMGGEPCVAGTRIPAQTIAACLDAGLSDYDIYMGYPWMPLGGIEAVRRWKAGRVEAAHEAAA